MLKLISVLLVSFLFSGCAIVAAFIPSVRVMIAEADGKAKYAEAEASRQIRVREAQAKLDAAKLESEAEIERAKGVAEANKIIGNSLKDNESYLRYLWIQSLESEKTSVIYVPTEANLPILEAGKRPTFTESKKSE